MSIINPCVAKPESLDGIQDRQLNNQPAVVVVDRYGPAELSTRRSQREQIGREGTAQVWGMSPAREVDEKTMPRKRHHHHHRSEPSASTSRDAKSKKTHKHHREQRAQRAPTPSPSLSAASAASGAKIVNVEKSPGHGQSKHHHHRQRRHRSRHHNNNNNRVIGPLVRWSASQLSARDFGMLCDEGDPIANCPAAETGLESGENAKLEDVKNGSRDRRKESHECTAAVEQALATISPAEREKRELNIQTQLREMLAKNKKRLQQEREN